MRISHNTTAPTCLGTLPNRRPTTIRLSPDWEAPSSGGNNLPSMIQTTGHLCLRERPYINIWVIERSLSEKLLVHQHDSNFLSKKSDLACCHSTDIYLNTSRIQIGNVFSEDKPLHRMIVEGKNADPWKHALLGKYKMRTLKKKTERERERERERDRTYGGEQAPSKPTDGCFECIWGRYQELAWNAKHFFFGLPTQFLISF